MSVEAPHCYERMDWFPFVAVGSGAAGPEAKPLASTT